MDELIKLLDSKLPTGVVLDLLVNLLFGLRGENGKLDSCVNLFVPLDELGLLFRSEAISQEALNESSGRFHAIVALGVVQRNGQDLFSGFVSGHVSSNLAHLVGGPLVHLLVGFVILGRVHELVNAGPEPLKLLIDILVAV